MAVSIKLGTDTVAAAGQRQRKSEWGANIPYEADSNGQRFLVPAATPSVRTALVLAPMLGGAQLRTLDRFLRS